ncbi:MAG: DUF177 domain-containing protein [Ruminococcaceae bacterium]|nr:DUF177 domain-containing protein [Oscillospiraceae bacterium]
MLLSLKDIFVNDGMESRHQYSLPLSDVELYGVYPFTSPVEVSATVKNKTGLVTLDVDVEYDYCAPCDRCFVDVKSHRVEHFSHRLVESLEGDYNDEYIETTDYKLDLSELVTTDILLSLPSKYLCKGDCQGLCQKCGHNLNLGECDCDKRVIDPRLEALKELLD